MRLVITPSQQGMVLHAMTALVVMSSETLLGITDAVE